MSNNPVLLPFTARFDSHEFTLYSNEDCSVVGTSVRGAAQILGVSDTAIHKRIKQGADETTTLSAEILTGGGIQGADLITPSVLFRLAMRYNSGLAVAMGSAGAHVFLLGLAGLQVKPAAPEAPKSIPLPPADVRLENFDRALSSMERRFGSDFISNPRLAQYFKDAAVNIVLPEGGVAALPAARWCGAAEIAESLGVSPSVIRRRGSALGRHVAAWYRREGREPSREARLVNGQQRQVMVYEDTPELRDVVANYFNN